MESLTYNGLNLSVWDIGGQESMRPYWKTYYPHTDCLIVVIDSADKKRFPIIKKEMEYLSTQVELTNVPICIMANKQDLKDASKESEVIRLI